MGVGASAGGLKAFKAFFSAVPASSPLAYVVIQHLDPSVESRLPKLLGRACALPVLPAEDGGSLRGGRVYVVPEGRVATVEDGVLRLRPQEEDRQRAIDELFTSLAVAPASACAVLLTGFGADGVQGLREIAATGGLTFAQDPATAEHAEMPSAAIDAGVADFVGTPEEIAARINEIAERLGVAAPSAAPACETAEDIAAMESILGYVERETGVDFRHYKPSTMRRRIGRRAMLRDIGTMAEYLDVLRNDAAEVPALLADLLINVTRFFRDEDTYEALRTRVFPEILSGKAAGDSIRIWVPGCSTGEEVYSILIALLETLDGAPEQPQITMFGTDLSDAALRRARAGVYPEDAAGSVSPERLERFFHRTEHGYEVDKSLRDRCVFARQDITRDTPFSRIDIVSLRNVLIYMDQQLQRTVLAVTHYALLPEGFLVLGTSESPESDRRLFRAVDKRQHIFRRADVPSRLPASVTGAGRPLESLFAPEPHGFDLRAAADAVALDAFAPPRVVVDAERHVVHFFGDTTPYLGHSAGRATLDAVEMAAPQIALELREAIEESWDTNASVGREATFTERGRERRVGIVVEPLATPRPYRLIAFEELSPPAREGATEVEVARLYEAREDRLRREIAVLRGRSRNIADEKEHTNEELRAANEEIQSSNEELQSLNEELETAKEELQSANEELITVNEELRQRNVDLALTNDDMSNFLTSTGIPVIMLDRDLRVRRFTPESRQVARLRPEDEGRGLGRVRMLVDVPDLEELARSVVDTLEVCEREVQDDSGRWYAMQIRPYRTSKDDVDGAVLSFFDVDDLHRSMERIAKRARLSDALNAIEADVASTLDFVEIVQRALDQGVAALVADAGAIEMRDADGWTVPYRSGFPGALPTRRLTDAEAPVARLAEKSRGPVSIGDTALEPDIDVGFIRERGVRSVLAAPLIVRDAVIGCLLFHRLRMPRPFGASDVDFVRRLGSAVSLAIENSRLFDEERRRTERMAALREIAEAGAASLHIEEAGARLIEAVSRDLGTSAAMVAVEHEGALWPVASAGYPPGFVEERFTPIPDISVAGRAFAEGRTVLIRDTEAGELSEWSRSISVELGSRAYAAMPLLHHGRQFGAVVFVWGEPHAFGPEEVSFLESVAATASAGLRNAHLFEETAQSQQRLSDVLDSLTDGFVSVDRQWRYTMVNPEAERLIGRPAEELLGESMEDVFPDVLGRPHLREVMDEGVAQTLEVWSKLLGKWLEVHAFPTREGLSILFADISKRKRSEELTEARLHIMAVASSPGATVDDMTRVVLDSLESLTGSSIAFYHFVNEDQETLSLQNWSTNTLATMCTADAKGEHYPISESGVWADAVRTGKRVIHNDFASLPGRRGVPDGHAPVVRELVVPIIRGGRVVSVIGVGNKATDYDETDAASLSYLGDLSWEMVERAQVEAALAEVHSRSDLLASLIEDSSQPLAVITGVDGSLFMVNKAYAELTGYSEEELKSIDWIQQLTPPEYHEYELQMLRELERTRRPVRYEKEYIRKDGTRVPLELLVNAIWNDDGEVEYYYSFNTDVTERKAAESALRESESRVRRKLDAILTPESEIGILDLADLIDSSAVQAMMEDFHATARVPMALIDVKGNILVGVGWQPICTQFHRVHPETCAHCIESDTELTANVPAGEAKLYRCKNGMWDMAAPIHVGGRHLGNVFTGQFFFDDEQPDYGFFRAQAKRYGFDEGAYVAALDAVPRFSREFVETGMDFLTRFADMLSKLGYSTAQLAHSVAERERNEARIRRHAAVTEGIGEILQAALSAETEEELGDVCLCVAESITGSAFGFVSELGPDGLLHDIAISDPGWAACKTFDKSGHRRQPSDFEIHGLYSRVFAEGKPFFTNSPALEPDSIGTPEGHPPLTSFLGVPLFSGGEVIGALNVANRAGGYSEADAEALEELAPVVVEAFQRKRAERASAAAKERLDAHIDNSPLAVIEFDAEFRITRWSDEAEQMFGWSADEVLGKAIGEFKWVYEDDEPLVEVESRNLLTAATPRSLNVNRNYRKDGAVIWCEWYDSAVYGPDGSLVSILSQVLDVTERKRAEEALRESEQRYRLLFANMLDGFAYCRMIFAEDGTPEDFVYIDVNSAFFQLTGLTDVVGKRVTEVIPGIRESNPELFEVYGRVAGGGESEHLETELDQLGHAYSISVYGPDPGYFVAIFHNITEERARLRLEESISRIRTAVSSTLEVDEVLHQLMTLAAETLEAEATSIFMKHSGRWVVTHADGMQSQPGEILTDAELPIARSAVAERRPIAALDDGGRLSRRRNAMRRFGVGSILVIPLIAQGRELGIIGLGRLEPRPFNELEMYFATRLTSIAALALDNALAYERERTIADTLQEAVLAPPPPIPGVETAFLYRAASSEANVGGDFYDIFELDGGKVGIVVGDVSGKGLEAARLTSLVRDGIRAYAFERDDPAWVVDRINSLMFRSSPVEAFATLFFGVLDVLSGELCYTAAGHPPAALCDQRGPEYLQETASAIVGAFEAADFTSAVTRMGPKDVLVLYTDGVTEARHEGELYGDDRLLDALGRLADKPLGLLPQALLDDVLSFAGGGLSDDTVIMCVQRALKDEQSHRRAS